MKSIRYSFLFIITLVGAIAITRPCSAQSFSGTIVYKVSYISRMHGVGNKELTKEMGTRNEFVISGGHYKSVYNGSLMGWDIFNAAENRLYYKVFFSDTVYFRDAMNEPDTVYSASVTKHTVKILGYTCNEVVLKTKAGVQKYYCAAALPLDASLYARHKVNHCSDVIALVNGLPLKYVLKDERFVATYIATSVTSAAVPESVFKLPEGGLVAPWAVPEEQH